MRSLRSIDTTSCGKPTGVLAVLTARDVPVNEYGLIMPDQPVLCGPGSNKPFAERVRFIGDQVALVVAEDERIAAAAVKLIKVDYQDLPVVSDARLSKTDMRISYIQTGNQMSFVIIRSGKVILKKVSKTPMWS